MSFTYNRITLIGRVGASPESRLTAGGQQVAAFNLATDRPARSGATPITDWHRVVCFDKLAEIALVHVAAGRLLFVEGAITYRTWQDQQDQQDQKRTVTEVVARELILLDRPPSNAPALNARSQTPVRRDRSGDPPETPS
jgi:single-strand DNA-binding protein